MLEKRSPINQSLKLIALSLCCYYTSNLYQSNHCSYAGILALNLMKHVKINVDIILLVSIQTTKMVDVYSIIYYDVLVYINTSS